VSPLVPATSPRIWFDVQDLLDYAEIATRPSGIQRVCLELYAALEAVGPERIGFLRHDPVAGTMRAMRWEDLAAHCAPLRLTEPPAPGDAAEAGAPKDAAADVPEAPRGTLRRALRWLAWRLPVELRYPMGEAIYGQIAAIRALGRAARATLPGGGSATSSAVLEGLPDIRNVAQPGDIVAAFGSPWGHPDYAALLQRCARPAGLRFAMLVHDLIPVVRPEFYEAHNGALFRAFMRNCLPEADLLLTMSRATARDVVSWAGAQGLALRTQPRALPVGIGFSHAAPGPLPEGLEAGSYVLLVGTLEARKNHLLAFRVWRRLQEELPPKQVPQLVFAGRVGWMVEDLMQQIRNSGQLAGKLTLIPDADDATLAALYRGARFTLFPSLYEGWGLPVTESLSFGKVCLASSAASLPEAGGAFCLYHDPDSVTDAARLVRRAIEEPGLIAELEARIAAEYRPTPWTATARAVLDAAS
jgi:glycosyltransferase involved in cell wall biosynthesis